MAEKFAQIGTREHVTDQLAGFGLMTDSPDILLDFSFKLLFPGRSAWLLLDWTKVASDRPHASAAKLPNLVRWKPASHIRALTSS